MVRKPGSSGFAFVTSITISNSVFPSVRLFCYSGKSKDFGVRVFILVSFSISCVTLDTLLDVYQPYFLIRPEEEEGQPHRFLWIFLLIIIASLEFYALGSVLMALYV